eukprot:TRINITY_DN17104_c0_g1_i8.p1 TRINITY_DN17104_c0_g1~~TRINITY_DN17104_c0_g1_i8.p1  ORF type:complete len:557 (+),score=84.83 TRINITY_DN17104_c0_g1_i8:315-1985(+)
MLKNLASDEALAEKLRRRRESCAEFESVPQLSTADVAATPQQEHAAEAAGTDSAEGVASAERCDVARKAQKTSDDQLQTWLAKIRGKCQVLESTPQATKADALWSEQAKQVQQGQTVILESTPELGSSDADWRTSISKACSQEDGALVLESTPSATTADACATPLGKASDNEGSQLSGPEGLRLRVKGGQPLPRNLRRHIWSEQLHVARPGVSEEASEPSEDKTRGRQRSSSTICGTSVISRLLLIEAGLDTATASRVDLAAFDALAHAFAEKYLASFEDPGIASVGEPAGVLCLLSQLLRYHFPERVERFAPTSAACNDLVSALQTGLGGSEGLIKLLFTPGSKGAEAALLLICDRAVLGNCEALVLFTALAILSDSVPRSSTTIQPEELCDIFLSFGSDLQVVSRLLDLAVALHDATPLSALSAHHHSESALSPICSVSPDELLTHVYESVSGAWRFVVVDVRSGTMRRALPLCVTLSKSEDRLAALLELPYEEAIHLCLVGDYAACPGDEAFELCRCLTGAPTFRKHVLCKAAADDVLSKLGGRFEHWCARTV